MHIFFWLRKGSIFFFFIYISPSNSSFVQKRDLDKQIFSKLEADIAKYSLRGDIMLMGDLNAHINCDEHDFIINDFNSFLPNNYITDSVHVLRSTQVHQNTNNYGKSIIELCSDSQLRILNGRTLGDSVGKATYFNYSGVTINDYCICSASVLKNITSFHVGEFDPNLSNHCPITVKIMNLN